MRVTLENGIYKGHHITGPTHNYLGVEFGRNEIQEGFAIAVLHSIAGCTHGASRTADEVRPWVEEGLSAAESEIGRTYQIKRMEIVANDSRRPGVYRELMRRIVLRHHEEQSTK